MRDARYNHADRAYAWTDELTQRLRQLWATGESASAIAKLIGNGMTRNAVIGKANRIGLARRLPPAPTKRKRRVLPPSPAKKEPVTRAQVRVTAPVPSTYVKEPPPSVSATLALKPGQCRWPIGHGYCDQKRGSSQSYCDEHGRDSIVSR